MSKITVEIDDTLDSRVESAIEDVKAELLSYLEDNEPDKVPDIGDDLDYSGAIHEIVDGSVPVYTKEINDIFYLHGPEVEQAFDDAGVGDKDDSGWPVGWRAAAIYCYIDQEVREWYADNAEDIFEEWQESRRTDKLKNVEVFEVTKADFLNAEEDTWMAERLGEAVKESLTGDYDQAEADKVAEDEAEKLEGFYWWTCSPGCLPDSEAFGPFPSKEAAEEDAAEY